jgi:hypothetical protein
MTPRIGLPHTFGWIRAPFADIPNAKCWETPSGEYVFIPHPGSFCVVKDIDGSVRIKAMRSKASK